MGGDDSQKLLPWRGSHSSPGHSKPPALLQNQHCSAKAVCLVILAGLSYCVRTG